MSSWKEPFDIHDLEIHVDKRGALFEILRFKDDQIEGGGQLYTFTVQPGARRGDHYHLAKQEWFTCVHGKVKVLVSHPDGLKKAFDLSAEKPQIIYTGPKTSHALLNEAGEVAVIVSYGSKQHDPADPDTYREQAFKDYGS